MKYILILTAILFTNKECHDSEKQNLAQEEIRIEYSSFSRGGEINDIKVFSKTIFYKTSRDGKVVTKACTDTQWQDLMKALNLIDVKNLETLEPPSKTHQYDGAAIASLKIEHEGKTYKTQSFDHGNPPKAISKLIDTMLEIAGINSSQKKIVKLMGNYQVIFVDKIEDSIVQYAITLNFDDANAISGHNSCNTFGGMFKIYKQGITFNQIYKTKKYCPENAQIEDTFMEQLKRVNQYNLEEDILLLMDNGKTVIKAEKSN